MSSKEQKTPEGQAPEEIIMDQHEEIEQLSQKLLLSRWIRAMKKLRISKLSWLKPRPVNVTAFCA
mgnify:CR=1 FL=1